MIIKILSPQWGHERLPLITFLDEVRDAGYDGLEMWLPLESADQKVLGDYLQTYEMPIVVHQHEANGNDFSTFKQSFANNLVKCNALNPLLINSHTGRDYFTLGNAAYNMSHHGNSWMMVRYGWSIHEIARDEAFLPRNDEKNYYDLELAKNYYIKAAAISQDKPFAGLCLRMAVKCDEFKEMTSGPRNYEQNQQVFKSPLRDELLKKFPDKYDELINDCGSFYKYIR